MNCKRSEEMISRYYDGDCNDIERLQFKHHLKECPECSQSIENLNEAFSLLQGDNTIEPPEDFEASIMHKITALELARKKNTELLVMGLFWAASVLTIILMTFVFVAIKDRVFSWIDPLGHMAGIGTIVGMVTQLLHRVAETGTEVLIQLSIMGVNMYKDLMPVAVLILMVLILQQGGMLGVLRVDSKGAGRKE